MEQQIDVSLTPINKKQKKKFLKNQEYFKFFCEPFWQC